MSLLSQVKKGKVAKPHLVLIYGPDGVGKSTFGAEAPGAIFLGTEDGTSHLDVSRFPIPKNFSEVLQALDELVTSKHEYKTLVIDSLDWMEPLVTGQVCADYNVDSIEKAAGGYGKGYVEAVKYWSKMMDRVRAIRERGMNTIVIAHSQVKTFNDPLLAQPYDRYQLKLNEKAAALWREFVDVVLFCNYETVQKTENNRTKAFSSPNRYAWSERSAGADAKNRLGLPPKFSLSYEEFSKHAQTANPEDPALLKTAIGQLVTQLKDDEIRKKVLEAVKGASDGVALRKIYNRVDAIVSAQTEA